MANPPLNISFAGCGFLGLYHLGVVSCIKTLAPNLFTNKVAGASAGGIAAVAILVEDINIGEIASEILNTCMQAR